jgi:hypothetical protein
VYRPANELRACAEEGLISWTEAAEKLEKQESTYDYTAQAWVDEHGWYQSDELEGQHCLDYTE